MKKLLSLLIIPITCLSQVNYQTDIQPIFDANCIGCHQGEAAYFGGLSLTSYAELIEGGYTEGGVISTGLLEDYITTGYMPAYGSTLSEAEINLISLWISEGALNLTPITDENILIGLWEVGNAENDPDFVEFFDDGSLLYYYYDDDCLLVDVSSLFTQYTYSENMLTLYTDNGELEFVMNALENGSIQVLNEVEEIDWVFNLIESLPIEMCDIEGCTTTEGVFFIMDNDLDNDGICDGCEEYSEETGLDECMFFDPEFDPEMAVCENLDFYQEVYVYDFNEEECILTTSCFCECINDSDGDGVCDENESIILIEDIKSSKELIKTVDILGRETSKKGLKIKIYNDGSIETKYIIE